MKKLTMLSLLLPLVTPAQAAEVSAECRGLAAGVVSEMKSDNEITDREMMLVAIKAARRACAAATDGLVVEAVAGNSAPAEEAAEDEDKMSVWDFLTQNQEKKAGNKRLDRLKN